MINSFLLNISKFLGDYSFDGGIIMPRLLAGNIVNIIKREFYPTRKY